MGTPTGLPRSVLHILPHPGGGGERYVDLLERMDGYRFERAYLTSAPGIAPALRLAPRLPLRAARRVDLVHVHGEVAGALCLPLLRARPSIVTLHGLHLLRRSTGATRRLAEANLRLLVRTAGRTICVAEAERDDALAVVGPIRGKRLRVVHNGVELQQPATPGDRDAARAELGLPPAAIAVAFAGALAGHKDPLSAARAVLTVRAGGLPVVLLVAGEGPLRADLAKLAADAAPDAIRLLGNRPDIAPLLTAADIFILPSLREGFSFALLEAMAAGLATIVSDAPGNPEAVGDTGEVVRRGDAAALAAALRRLAEAPGERRELGARARERVAAQFTTEEMVRATAGVYAEVLDR